jgi:hypothetical protein
MMLTFHQHKELSVHFRVYRLQSDGVLVKSFLIHEIRFGSSIRIGSFIQMYLILYLYANLIGCLYVCVCNAKATYSVNSADG